MSVGGCGCVCVCERESVSPRVSVCGGVRAGVDVCGGVWARLCLGVCVCVCVAGSSVADVI